MLRLESADIVKRGMATANASRNHSQEDVLDGEYTKLDKMKQTTTDAEGYMIPCNMATTTGAVSSGSRDNRTHVGSAQPPPANDSGGSARGVSDGVTHQRAPHTRCLVIVNIVMGVVLVIHTALFCFVMVKLFQGNESAASLPDVISSITTDEPASVPGAHITPTPTKADRTEPTEQQGGGVVYTRWGRTTCDGTDVDLVYSGVVGGAHYNHTGSGANYLCMHREPQWANYSYRNLTARGRGLLYGAEYELPDAIYPGKGLFQNDVPCAVCRPRYRTTVMMIPGRLQCPDKWSLEYKGYLMTEHHVHKARTMFECMDADPEVIQGGDADHNGALFYPVEGVCGSLPCPNYVNNRELTCVVCTL